VATVNNYIITFVGAGSATITATQEATNDYLEAITPTTCIVSANTNSNPVQIVTGTNLEYFLATTAEYGKIVSDITVTDTLVGNGKKVITSSQFIRINKSTE
jgi:hypothetical protein